MFTHEYYWARYQRSDGGPDWITLWWRDDADQFEHKGITYTRVGPIVKAYTKERAIELLAQRGEG